MKQQKYNAKKSEYNGIKFDSKKEMNYYISLLERQEAGEIGNIRLQVKYELIPNARLPNGELLRGISYIADFVFTDIATETDHVVDVKGCKFGQAYAMFKLKKKLMYYFHKIVVEEV